MEQVYLTCRKLSKILDEAAAMVELLRCRPETPRQCVLEQKTLKEIRAKVESTLTDRT